MINELAERHDSLSPVAGPYLPVSKCSNPQALPQVAVNVKRNTEYKFILAKVSDFDKTPMASVHDGVIRKVSPKRAQDASRDLQRLPSLAATHPALYQGAKKTRKQELPSSSSPNQHRSRGEKLAHRRVQTEALARFPPAPWQTYVDPKRLTSQDPDFSDPKIRMLKDDVQSSHCRVLSPVFMIGLPCGTIIEAAHYYNEGRGQPRDAPSS